MRGHAQKGKTGLHVLPEASAGAGTATATHPWCLLQRVAVQLLASQPAWQLPWRQRTLEWWPELPRRLRGVAPAQQGLRPSLLTWDAQVAEAQRSRMHLALQRRGQALLVGVQPCQQPQVLLAHLGPASKQPPPPLPSLPTTRC